MKKLISIVLAAVSLPAIAQDLGAPPPVPVAVETVEEDGLTGEVTDESEWQDLGIAIPSCFTTRGVPARLPSGLRLKVR